MGLQTKPEKNGLKEKVFIPRPSLLTTILEEKHKRFIQNCCIALLIFLVLNDALINCLTKDRCLDLEILSTFGQFHVVVALWLMMQTFMIVGIYFAFRLWALYKPNNQKIADDLWLILYMSYLLIFCLLPPYLVFKYDLPRASSTIIVMEQIRMVMKSHSFALRTYSKIDQCPTSKDGKFIYPKFSTFLYFLFAPTLLYRDEYPRTSHIRWTYVGRQLFLFFACVYSVYLIGTRFRLPIHRRIGHEPITLKFLLQSLLQNLTSGVLLVPVAFYGHLHVWLNLFAELLRFGDRLFYEDWWNSTTYAEFYRTWNIPVHDWLYTYIFKDVYKVTGSAVIAKLAVFVLSSIIHEYLLIVALKFFLPTLLLLFWAGAIFSIFAHSNSRLWNIVILYGFVLGIAFMFNTLSLELNLRHNCPLYNETFLESLKPRLLQYEVCYNK